MVELRKIDWIGVEKFYRAGQISIRAIGSRFNVSHVAILKKSKEEKWERDLAQRVRQQVTRKLVTTQVTKTHASEEEIVDKASDIGVKVVLSHRKDILKLRALESSLLGELSGKGKNKPKKLYITQYQGEIVQKEIGLTVTERAGALRDLSKVQQTRITLERQAFNLDEEKTPDPADGKTGFVYEHLLAAIIFQRKTLTSSTKELTDGKPE